MNTSNCGIRNTNKEIAIVLEQTDSVSSHVAGICDSFSANIKILSYPFCSGMQWNCTGDMRVSLTGGTPPFIYSWAGSTFPGSTTYDNDTVFNLCSVYDNYFACIVTDSLGCESMGEKDLLDQGGGCDPSLFNYSVDSISCPGIPDGQVCVWWPIGMSCGWYYHWSNGSGLDCLSGLSSGTYTCWILSGNNSCYPDTIYTQVFTLSEPDNIFPVTSSNTGCGFCNGSVTLNSNISNSILEVQHDGNTLAGFTLNNMCADSTYILNVYYEGYDEVCMVDTTVSVTCVTMVYPGDANNDGVANNVDLLSIGIAFNDTGAVRVDTTITWDAKYVQDWQNIFVDGTNHKHADCNGDGIVNDNDTTAINLNFGFTHNRPATSTNIAGLPTLTIDLPQTVYSNSQTIAPVLLGDALTNADSVYGIAFSIYYNSSIVDEASIQFDITNSWLGSSVELLMVQHNDAGRLDIAVTRKDHVSISGTGEIGRLNFHTTDTTSSLLMNTANIVAVANDGSFRTVNSSFDSTAVLADTNLVLWMISSPELDCNSNSLDVYLTVLGGTPPYNYQWSSTDQNVSLVNTCDTCQNLIDIAFSGFYPEGMTVMCVVEDSVGRKDSLQYSLTPNYPPIIVNGASENPLCNQYQSGVVWAWSSIMNPSGPPLEIHETNLDSGTYIYIIPYGNGCEKEYEFRLDYMVDDCDSAVTFNISVPDCGICNGNVSTVDHVGATISSVYDSNGDLVPAGQFCVDSTYYANFYYAYDINTWYENTYSVTVTNEGCTPIFPGDANNDGVANNVDLLSIGIAFNDTGSVRVDSTITWDAKYVQDWTNVFADSVNYKHADCNGDGFVNDADTTAITLNYGFTHSRSSQLNILSAAPVLSLDMPQRIIVDSLVSIPVLLGDSAFQVDNIHGIAFSFYFTHLVAGNVSAQFIPDSSWLGNDLLSLQYSVLSDDRLDVAVTRRDNLNASGAGVIGTLNIKVPVEVSVFNIAAVGITAISNSGSLITISGSNNPSPVVIPAGPLDLSYDVDHICWDYWSTIDITINAGTPPFTFYELTPGNPPLQINMPYTVYTGDGYFKYIEVVDSNGVIDSVFISIPNTGEIYNYYVVSDETCPGADNGYYYVVPVIGSNVTCDFTTLNLSANTYTEICQWGWECSDTIVMTVNNLFPRCSEPLLDTVYSPDCGQCNGHATLFDFTAPNIYLNNTLVDPDGNPVNMQFLNGKYYTDSTLCAGAIYFISGGWDDPNNNINDYDLNTNIYVTALPGCSPVFPGDANNDGVANNIDLLSIGLAYADTGQARTDTTITWDGKYTQNWSSVFADSTNHKFADCDGSGEVDANDTLAINQNYGLTHNRNVLSNIAGVPYLNVDLPATLSPMSAATADVIIGDAGNVCNDLYGFAFSVNYDPLIIDQNSIQFIPDSSWYGSANEFLTLQKRDLTSGVFYAAITRKDHVHQSGYGTIGKLLFNVLPGSDTTFTSVSVSQVYAINNNEVQITLNTGIDSALYTGSCGLYATLLASNSCSGLCDGSVIANVIGGVGPLSYDWSLSVYDSTLCSIVSNVNPLTGISTGNYICIVTDSTGCTVTTSFSSVFSSGINATSTINYETCSSCDGSIDLTVLNGIAPYTFLWDDGSVSEDLTNRCTYYSSYLCTVTDSLGCQFFFDYQSLNCIPQNGEYVDDADCPYSDNGRIEYGPVGPPYYGCAFYGGFVNPICGLQGYDANNYVYYVENACPGNYTFIQISRMGCDTSYIPIVVGYDNVTLGSVHLSYPTCNNCNGSILALDNGDTINVAFQNLIWIVNGIQTPTAPAVLTGLCEGDSVAYTMTSDFSMCNTVGIVYVDSCLVSSGLTEVESWKNISIHPNPNNGSFKLSGLSSSTLNSIEITNVIGEIVYTVNQVKSTELKVDAVLKQGIYICRVVSEEKQMQLKFVVY
ncbi:MAG: T9SS type A sorting domain-containing protein [Bacteroidota bacterium]